MKKILISDKDFFKSKVLEINNKNIISIQPSDEEILIESSNKLENLYICFNDVDNFPGCCGLEVFSCLCSDIDNLKLTSKQETLLYECFFEWFLLDHNIHPKYEIEDPSNKIVTKALITLAVKSQNHAVNAIDNLALKYSSIKCLYMFKNPKTGNFVKMYCLNT